MKKIVGVFIFILTVFYSGYSQEITGDHKIQESTNQNEYTIKTTITGLSGVDIARITYYIPKEHLYKPSSNNSLFSNQEEKFIKFYIMAIPSSGVINIELGIVLKGEGNFDFPVEFQYSKNEEKKVVKFSPIIINNQPELVADVVINNNEETSTESVGKAEEERLAKEKAAAEKQAKYDALIASADQKFNNKDYENAKSKYIEATTVKKETYPLDKTQEINSILNELAKEKAEEERLVKEKLEEELKTKEEKEANAEMKRKAEEERIAKEKAAADAQAKKEAEKLAELEAKKLEEERLAKAKAENESKKIPIPSAGSTKYTVQIFALSKYSEQKVANFCERNNLDINKINTINVNGITKVRYGYAYSEEDAEKLRKDLLTRPQINGAFIVKIDK
jgi:chemotaxis protein histidine kinase CheA